MTTQRLTALVGTVLFMAYAYGYFGWALAAAAVLGLGWCGYRGWVATVDRLVVERQRHEQIAVRADIQHAQVLNGDPRGTFGSNHGHRPNAREPIDR
jgi:hypothetical protein